MREEGGKFKRGSERGDGAEMRCCNEGDESEVAEEEERGEARDLIGQRKERIMHGTTAEKEGRKWRQKSLEIQLLAFDFMLKFFLFKYVFFFLL